MRSRSAAVWVGVLLLLVLAAYAWNVAENHTAQQELDEACDCAHRSVERTIAASGPLLDRMFSDGDAVRGALREEVRSLCGGAREQLTWWRWGAGRSWTPARDAERRARIRDTLATARARCPEVYPQVFGDPGSPQRVSARCGELFDRLEATQTHARTGLPVWSWPDVIRSSMCLPEAGDAAGGSP